MAGNPQYYAGIDVVYYTDPMCCWSYGMQRHWKKFVQACGTNLRYRYCMGGLLPSWNRYRDPVHAVSRPAQMGPVWMEAAHLVGTAINNRIWIDDPPSSSYLSCVAVKCAGFQSQVAEEIYLQALREAVMLNGKNIAYQSVLLAVARTVNDSYPGVLDLKRFAMDMENGKGIDAFRMDLQEIQQRQITRFPTLIFRSSASPAQLVIGYRTYDDLLALYSSMMLPVENGAAF